MSIRVLGAGHTEVVETMQWLHPGEVLAAEEFATASQPTNSHGDASEILIGQQRRIQELEHQVEVRCRESFQNGHAAGTTAALEQAEKQLEPVMARLVEAVSHLTGLRRKVRAEAEEDAMRLALAVAKRILHREISTDPDALLGLMKAALQRIDARELHRLRMHPLDIAQIEKQLDKLGMPARLEVVADPTLERGAVLFDTTRGQLDASVSTQLVEIERGFLDVVRRGRDAF